MEQINRCLKGLLDEKEPMTTAALAKKIGATSDNLRSQLSTLKRKGYVDGNSTEGWVITQEGRESVERGDKIPFTARDAGTDVESKLKYYGQLHGVPQDLILATVEMIMNRDPESLEDVWECMTEMGIEIVARRRWFASWRNYLKQAIPPALMEKVRGTTAETKGAVGEEGSASAGGKGRDYIIVDDLPVFVGAGAGDYSLPDAKDLLNIRAIRSRLAGGGGGGGQGWGPSDVISIIDKIKEKSGNGGGAKTYVVQHTEQGTVVKALQPGEPLVLSSPGEVHPPQTFFVDNQGNITQAKPGEPLVIKQQSNPPPAQKTLVVRQTDKGIVTEEYESGRPIILNTGASGGGGGIGLPFPVFGNDGKPLLDSEGRPVYANLEPTLKWLGFQAEQKRADERHTALMGLVQTVRENVPDGINALVAAAKEAREQKTGTGSPATQPQVYECGDCKTQFTIPVKDFERVGCPKCGHVYTRQEVLGQ